MLPSGKKLHSKEGVADSKMNKELKALLNSHVPRSHRKRKENSDVQLQDKKKARIFIASDKWMWANMIYANSMQLLFEDGVFEQRCVEKQHVQECAGAVVAWPRRVVAEDMEF